MSEYLPASSDEFGTPDYLFAKLNEEYLFTLDAAASESNAKCKTYYTKETNGLLQSWFSHRVWCNPPYSRGMKEAFARKAYEETERACPLAVLLLPTCTDQSWFHELVTFPRVLVYPIQGRVRFVGGETSARDSHMILVFRNRAFVGWRK